MRVMIAFFASFILGASASIADDTRRPWPEYLSKELPSDIQQVVRDHVRSTASTIDYVEHGILTRSDREDFLIKVALGELLQTNDGLLRLLDILETTDDAELKLAVAERFAAFGRLFSFAEPAVGYAGKAIPDNPSSYAPAIAHALEKSAALARTPDDAVQLAQYFTQFQQRRLLGSLHPALERAVAVETKDGISADSLRMSLHNLFSPGSLPPFFYGRFPAITVDVPQKRKIRAIVLGDFGTGRAEQFATAEAIRAEHLRKPYDLGITVGDNFMPNGLNDPDHPRWRTEWEEPYGSMGITFYPVLGNHDYEGEGAALAQIVYSEQSQSWSLPSPNYSVHTGLIDFFAVDTNTLTQPQLDWLGVALHESTAQWKIVYGHHPIYSSGYISDHTHEPANLVDRLLPVLKAGGVDAYFNGHNHIMEEWVPQDGVHLFTVGAGGSTLSNTDKSENSLFFARQHGFVVLEVSEDELNIKFKNTSGSTLHERVLKPKLRMSRGGHERTLIK